MKLNIKIIILLGIIIQLVGNYQISLIAILPNCKASIYNCVNDNSPHPKNYDTYPDNYINHSNRTVITHPYKKDVPYPLFYKSQIYIKNDSINMFHIFYEYPNIYQKKLPFIQLGLQNILSEKIISLGGGKRYVYNDLYGIGCNAFYHFPVSKTTHQPFLININGECWYHNILFVLNNFYKINNCFFLKKIQESNIQQIKHGHQIYMQIYPKNHLELTGKIILEHLQYEKKTNKNFYDKNNRLILGIDYYPISMVGFNINKIFENKKNKNTTCQILINYQFNVPIMQQINYSNNNKINSSILTYLNTTIQPFIPTVTNTNINYHKNPFSYEENILKSSYQKIQGYPGEIKIVEIDISNEEKKYEESMSINWNTQSLKMFQKYGGSVVRIKKNIYAIYIPHQSITKKNKIILSYVITNNPTSNKCSHITKKILISVHDFQNKIPSCLQVPSIDNHCSNISTSNNDITNNVKSDNDQIYTSTFNENHYYDVQNHTFSVISDNPNLNMNNNLISNDNKQIKQDESLTLSNYKHDYNKSDNNLPSHYPTPISSLSEENIIMTNNTNNKEVITPCVSCSTLPTPPPFPTSSPLLLKKEKSTSSLSSFILSETQNQKNNKSTTYLNDNEQNNNTSYASSLSFNQEKNNKEMISHTSTSNNDTNSISSLNQNLLHLLSIHKKSKFASIGTIEHINKLENTIINRKKHYLSEMEEIFSKLHITQSISSTDESYTTDESD